jgi:hypothetical protein
LAEFAAELAPGRAVEHKTSSGTNVTNVLPLQRRQLPGAAANRHSAEAFWRKSMVPASIGMGVIIVAAVTTLVVGMKTGWLGHDSANWVLVAALVSVIGLTKIVIANMFFFLLMQDDARLDPRPAPPPPTPGIPIERQAGPLRMRPRVVSTRARRRPDRRKRTATLSAG